MASALQDELPLFASMRGTVAAAERAPPPGPPPPHPSDMWPKGRLNRKASVEALRAERAWQLHWKAVCLHVDDGCQLRAGWVEENIDDIDQELKRRQRRDG